MSFSPQSSHSSTINRHNDWSSQSSVGSSSSGSLSRTALPSISSKNDIIHCHQFKDIVDHCERGLSECISSIESELNINKSVIDNWKSNETSAQESQILLLVNHKDSLRQQLSRIRHLRDEYETHLRLREALIKMMRISKSRECDTEWKDNSKVLIGIERQLELMIGFFHLRVEEIEGWARICPRDQYELEFRHGRQRRICRVRIGRDGQREWEQQEFQFQASLLDSIIVRVREVKSGWTKRYVTLGVTHIETRDLMRSRPQLMSLMANSSGSLKLKVRTKWTPAISSFFNGDSTKSSNSITSSHSNGTPLMSSDELSFDDRSASRLSSRESTLELLSQLLAALEDFQGQYEELVPMNAAVNRLWKLMAKDPTNHSKFSSSDEDDIDAALAEFEFLDTEDQTNSVISRDSTSVPLSSQWEACVVTHTRDAIIQLSHCGQWVLKAREKDALNRLSDDAFALQELANNYGNSFDDFIGDDTRVRDMWSALTNGHKSSVIVVDWRSCADSLNLLMHSHDSSEDVISDSSEWLTAKISECDYVTLLHMRAFWHRFNTQVTINDVLRVALDVSRVIRAKEVQLLETYLSRFIARDWSPHEVTWAAIRQMLNSDPQIQTISRQWLQIKTKENEVQILHHLLSGLESNSVTTRRASCNALAHIRADESIEQLLYVSTEDNDHRVREEARKALTTFGSDARQRWHQCSLTQMGFTGLSLSGGPNDQSWTKNNKNGKINK